MPTQSEKAGVQSNVQMSASARDVQDTKQICSSSQLLMLQTATQVEAAAFARVRESLARQYRNANMRPEQASNYARWASPCR